MLRVEEEGEVHQGMSDLHDYQARDLRIAICTPAGQFKNWTSQCIPNLVANFLESKCGENVNSKTCRFFVNEGSVLPEVRTALILSALKYDATHILWIDSDMVFPWNSIQLLLRHGKHFVGVNYPRRTPPHIPTTYKTTNEDLTECGESGLVWSGPYDQGLQEVTHVGFGLVLMEMTVVLGIREHFGKDYPFFKHKEFGYKFGGEDVHFCHSAIEAGFKIYVDHDLSKNVAHLGEMPCTMKLAGAFKEAGVDAIQRPENWVIDAPQREEIRIAGNG